MYKGRKRIGTSSTGTQSDGVNKFDEVAVVKTVRRHSDFLSRNICFIRFTEEIMLIFYRV